jgi:CRP/FNR family transcriptional regulator
MSQICLPLGIDKNEIKMLEELVEVSTTKQRGDTIFHQGEAFKKVYAVKSGLLKSVRVDKQGNEYVLGFHLPGELVGLDGIYPERYSCKTSSLDTTVLCEMNYEKLSELCISIPALQKQLLRLLSRDIFESHISSANIADQTAKQKIANFLHNLSARYELRGYSASEFHLSMSRQDIASHLGITPSTVSRMLKILKQDGIIELNGRHVGIIDSSELDSIIQCSAVA